VPQEDEDALGGKMPQEDLRRYPRRENALGGFMKKKYYGRYNIV